MDAQRSNLDHLAFGARLLAVAMPANFSLVFRVADPESESINSKPEEEGKYVACN